MGRRRSLTIDRLRSTCQRDGNGRCLRPAAREGADPVAVAIVAFERMHGGRHPRLTTRRREHLERSCALIDRAHGRQGAGLEALLSLMDTRLGWTRRGETALTVDEIASLDFYVCQLRQEARQLRRARRRKPPLPVRTDWREAWWSGRKAVVAC